MKLSEFKEKGYEIKETAFLSHAVFSVELDDLDELTEDSVLSGEIEEMHYDDEVSVYDVFDSKDKIVAEGLQILELIDFIDELD